MFPVDLHVANAFNIPHVRYKNDDTRYKNVEK